MSVVLVLMVLGIAAVLVVGFRAIRRERDALRRDVRELSERLRATEDRLLAEAEDLVVLTHVIMEHGLADEDDLEEIRHRVVEVPLRRAEEREELLRLSGLNVEDERIVVDDDPRGRGTLH